MKKHGSVLGFYARSSVYKVLLVLLIMALTELGVFLVVFQGELANYHEIRQFVNEEGVQTANLIRPENLMERSNISWFFAVAGIMVSVILSLPGCEFGSKAGYTIKRLQISERACFFWQVFCNLTLYFLVYVVQIALAFGFGQYYIRQAPSELVGNQSVFLMFYRSEFLHALLPLADIRIWIRNLFLLVGLSFASASFSYQQRRKKRPMALYLMLVCTLFFFSQPIGDFSNYIFLVLVSLSVITKQLFTVLQEEEVS